MSLRNLISKGIFTTGETPYKDWPNSKVWVKVKMGYRLPQPKGMPP